MRNDTPNIYGSVGVTLPIATLALGLRLVSRRLTKAGYGFDDAFAVVSFVRSTLGNCTSIILVTSVFSWAPWGAIYYGLGRPMEYGLSDGLTLQKKHQKSWLLIWCGSMTYTFAIAFSKFAILTLYWRLFKYSSIRIPVQVLSVLTVAWFILRLFMVTLQCIPIQALWDASSNDAHCDIDESTFFFSTVLTHVLIDCAILALPVIEVGRMKLPKDQKVGVIALFTFGALVCVASVFVLIESSRFDSHSRQITLEMSIHTAWAVAECNLAIISASLPMLRPIIRKIVPGSFLNADSGGQSVQGSSPLGEAISMYSSARVRENYTNASSLTYNLASPDGGPSDFHQPESDHKMQSIAPSPWRKYRSSGEVDHFKQDTHLDNEMAEHVERV